MRRRLGALLVVAALLFPLRVCFALSRQPEPTSFTFLDITDTHQTASGSTAPLEALVTHALAMNPRPAFVVDTGDVTESGSPEEFARFKSAIAPLESAGIHFYAVPGNHDVRWCPLGKLGFENQFGKNYQSFDYGGAHFILLDSTVLLEHLGHFDRPEMQWLARDLKRVRPETPVFVFMHHWIGRDTPAARPIDNEFDLKPLLQGHNVVAIFVGHGHQDLVWQTNGVETLMARGLYQGSYYQVGVTPELVNIDRYTKEHGSSPLHIATLPTAKGAHVSVLRVEWDDPDVPFLARRRPAATLSPRAVTDDPEKERAEYRIDDGPFRPMRRNARDIWEDTFQTAGIPVGMHSADVRLTTSNNVTYEDELIFEVERDSREPTRRWAIDLGGAIQSNPLLDGNNLYVSCLDGNLYCLDARTGKRRWAFRSRDGMVGSPILAGRGLVVGSLDDNIYCLDPDSGSPIWRYDTGSPVFSTPAVSGSILCVGCNRKIVGLDVRTGKPVWSTPAGSFFQSRAAADGGIFFLGGWDNTLYALDAATGVPKWTDRIGRLFYFSPAVSSPAVANGRVYVCTCDGVLHALDEATGHSDWSIKAPKGHDVFGYSSPAVEGTQLFVAGLGDHGDVYAVDTGSGHIDWDASIGQSIWDSSPSLSPDGKSLAIMAVRGHVAILSTSNGAPMWSYELGPGNIFSTPINTGRVVYTVTMADDVQCINAPGVRSP